MPYEPLSKEQYDAALKAGFSPAKILGMEKQRKQIEDAPAKKDFLQQAADVGNAIFPGTKEIGESLVKAGTNVANLATGGIPKFKAGLSENTVDVPRLAGAYAGNAGSLALAGAPVSKGGALARIAGGAATGYASDVATGIAAGEEAPLTPGAGTVVGAAIPGAGAAFSSLNKFSQDQAPRIINSLIKPLAKDFSYGKNPGRAISELKIVANDFDELGTKINEQRQLIGQEIGAIGTKISTEPIIQLGDSISPIDDAIRTAASQNNRALLARLQGVKQAITHILEPELDEAGNVGIKVAGERKLTNLTFQEARDILRNIGDVTQFTGNPSDDKAVNSALKRVYGNVKGHTLDAADKINPELASEFRKLTEQYGDLTSAGVATEYRDKIIERSNLIGFNSKTAAAGSGLITAIATGGAALPAIAAGIAGGVLAELASSPAFKTRLAAALAKKSAKEVRDIYKAVPALKNILPLAASRVESELSE